MPQTDASLSFTELVFDASLPVQLVMLFLLALSIISWTIIFQRFSQFKKSRKKADEFEDKFWSGIDLNSLYQECIKRQENLVGLEVIYAAGFKEFVRLVNSGHADQEVVMDGTYRQMKVASNREVEALETHLTTLATIGSISPYIGLFGTVWGIMHAFVALAAVKNATLAMVAPPIAEALIATAMGLFAAIPAVMCYNRFASRLEGFENRYLNFMDEFATILNRRLVTLRSMPQTQSRVNPQQAETQSYAQEQTYAKEQVNEVKVGPVVPPRTASDKTEAKLPDHAAVREISEYGAQDMSNVASSNRKAKVSPAIFSNVGSSPLKAKPQERVTPKEYESAPVNKTQEVPQYRVGIQPKTINASFVKPTFTKAQAPQVQETPKEEEQGPHYRVGLDPNKVKERNLANSNSNPVQYRVGPSPRQQEVMERARQELNKNAPAYRVGVTPEQMQRANPNLNKEVPAYQVGPRPLTEAERARREQSLSEEPHYLTPGVNGDHLPKR